MELMLALVYKFLSEREHATFNQIFTELQSKLKDKWKSKFPDMNVSDINYRKKGELFVYLNTDGRFILVDNNHWALTHNYSFTEIKKLRANVGENKE